MSEPHRERSRDAEYDVEAASVDARRARVYLPCPACQSAVLLGAATHVGDQPETYRCPVCGAEFFLSRD